MRMKNLLAVLLVLPLLFAAQQVQALDIYDFEVMTAVSGPFVGYMSPIRGLNGGGLPWMIDSAVGHLSTDGDLKITVRGLVLADDMSVPEEKRMTNPVPYFRGVVSCLTVDEMGMASTFIAATGNFHASTMGDADIEEVVKLPYPCVAPLVFVTSPGYMWFAVSGH